MPPKRTLDDADWNSLKAVYDAWTEVDSSYPLKEDIRTRLLSDICMFERIGYEDKRMRELKNNLKKYKHNDTPDH